MTTLLIEHVEASELPPRWAQRLHVQPGQTVTVRIETEEAAAPQVATDFVTDDPAFGIWRDREDMANVQDYVRKLRAPRYNRDDSHGDETNN